MLVSVMLCVLALAPGPAHKLCDASGVPVSEIGGSHSWQVLLILANLDSRRPPSSRGEKIAREQILQHTALQLTE